MSKEAFQLASVAAEESLDFMLTAESLASKDKQAEARRCLKAIDAFATLHFDTVHSMEPELAAVAEGKVYHEGPYEPVYFSNVHLAVASLWLTIGVLNSHPDFEVPPNLCEWLGVNTSQLRAGLIRERAKLLAITPTANDEKPEQSNDKPATLEQKLAGWFHKDPDAIAGLTAKQLGLKFKCSASAVAQTNTWKLVMAYRERSKHERGERDKHKHIR